MELAHKNFYKDILIKGGSDFLTLIIGIITIHLLTKSLGGYHYGIFSQIQTTATLIVSIALLKLTSAFVRYFPDIISDRGKVKNVFILTAILIFILQFIIAVILLLDSKFTSKLIFNTNTLNNLVIFLVLLILSGTLFNFVVDFFRAINKIKYSSIIGLSQCMLVCIFIVYSTFSNYGIKGCLLSYICSQIIISLIILILIFRVYFKGVKSKVDFFCVKPYLVYSLPLVPYSILVWITDLSDRYFITYFLGLQNAGIYALSYNIVSKAFIIYVVIAYVIYPHISQLWSRGDSGQVKRLLEKGCNIFLYFAIPITLGFTYLSSVIIRLIAGKDFIVNPLVILFICVGFIFLGIYGIYSYIIDLSQKTYIVLYILIITATLNIVLNIILIPFLGIMGAAVSTLLTYAIQVTIVHFLSRKLINIRVDIDLFYILKCFFASLLMILILNKINININMNDMSYLLISCFIGALVYFLSTGIMFGFKFNKFLKLIS